MIKALKWLPALLLAGFFTGTAWAAPFLTDSYWDSGKAEFQEYDVRMLRYGIQRQGAAKIIIVKEPFDREKRVKSRNSPDEVLKMNFICTVPTGVYDYHQMASLFFDRPTGALLKYTMSSQDGCGTTFMQYTDRNGRHEFTFHSYFDDEGDFQTRFQSDRPLYFYDALPLVLRFRIAEQQEYRVDLVPSLISSRTVNPAVVSARVRSRKDKVSGIAGRPDQDYYVTTVTYENRTDTFYFETAFPHRLVQWHRPGGERLQLTTSRFFYYWQHTAPGETLQSIP